jgi:hypothetical protein
MQPQGVFKNEVGSDVDKRRFRANLYLDLKSASGCGKGALVGRKPRVGATAVMERVPSCWIICA